MGFLEKMDGQEAGVVRCRVWCRNTRIALPSVDGIDERILGFCKVIFISFL